MTTPNHNYFEILGLKEQFSLDLSLLDSRLAQLQASVHPDNSASATSQEKRLMMQYSAMLNEAYTALKDPIKRASHLIQLQGLEVDEESTTAIPSEFLALQMELREQLDEIASSRKLLKEFLFKTEKNYHLLMKDLGKLLDEANPEKLVAARELMYNLQFFTKLIKETKSRIDNLSVQES